MEDIKLEESLDFVDAIDFANNLHPYEEGAADYIHKGVNFVKNVFGTKAGAAQRAQADAQQNLQTAQANQQASQMNAQANSISGPEAAQNIINILQKSFKKAQVTQQKAAKAANKEAENQKKENEKQRNKTQPAEGGDGK